MSRRVLLVALILLGACRWDVPPTGPTTVTQTVTVTTTTQPTPTPTPTPTPGTPTPTGNRTPDPSPGSALPLPIYGASVVEAYANSAAGAAWLKGACPSGGSAPWAFLDGVVDALRQHDTRWGYLCKRGDCSNPSSDNVAYHNTAGPDITGATGVIAVDVIGDLCGKNAPQWAIGAYDPAGVWSSRGRF
jgi:hypothetical protein